MSSYRPLLLAPITHGLQTDLQPWQAPPDSFPTLTNLHVEHGFLERRNGYRQFGDTLSNGTAVVGLEQFVEVATGIKTLLAWDTVSAYSYSPGTQTFTQLTPATIMNGGSSDYIWAAQWYSTATNGSSAVNRLYFTNGLPLTSGTLLNGIRYFDGGATTTLLNPTDSGFTGFPYGAKFIFSLNQRLVFLNTYEDGFSGSGTEYPQRARWSAKQNPGTNGWDDTVAGQGSYSDASTGEQIVSAQLLQNKIIVFFTDSVWALVPIPDPNIAFRWQKINNFRACGGRKASVKYDRYVAAIGNRGITATDGANTTRVDEGISDYSINQIAQNTFDQVFCGRDFSNKRWWSLYNSTGSGNNDRALIYDDDSASYSTYEIGLNCLGYGISGYDYSFDEFTAANGFASPSGGDIRWEDFDNDKTFADYSFQENTQLFLGGGFDGTVYELESTNYDIDTGIDSEFFTAAWNPFNDQGLECQMPYVDFFVQTSPTTEAQILFYKDTSSNSYAAQNINFLPDLGFISDITNITKANPCQITTLNSHGLSDNDQVYIYLVQGMTGVNSTEFASSFTVTVVDAFNFTIGVDSTAFSDYEGGGTVYWREFYRTKTWKRVYAGGIGFWHQLQFISSGLNEPYRIHAIKPYFKPIGKRTIN